jgi:hypothetical protein
MPAPFSLVVIGPPAHPIALIAVSAIAAIKIELLFFILPPVCFFAVASFTQRSRATAMPPGSSPLSH